MKDTYGIGVKVTTDVAKAQNDLNNMQGSLTSMIKSFGKVAGVTATFTAALVLMKRELIASYQASLQFNKGMANVATLIPGNIKRVEELKEGVKKLSVETGKPLSDLTDGLYQVISAFGDSVETQERLAIVNKSAVAGMSSTTDSLNLLSAVTKAYGDTSAVAMSKVSDLSFLTLKLGQTSYPDLARSIQQVTDSSVRMNVSQEELFTAFATLTGVSGDASTVATQLRGALVALEAPSKELAKLYDELGVASGRAFVEQYGLQGALEQVIEYSDRTGVGLQQLMGRVQAMSAAYNLGSSQADTYTWKLSEIQDALGATDDAFAEVSEGINKQGYELDRLKAGWEVVRTQIGDAVQPAFESVIRTTGNVVNSLITSKNTAIEMATALEDLTTKTNRYKNALSGLDVDVDNLTASEKVLYDLRTLQYKLDMQQSAIDLSKTYEKSQKEIDGLNSELVYYNNTLDKNIRLIENATEEQKASAEQYYNNWMFLNKANPLLRNSQVDLYEAILDVGKANELTTELEKKRAEQLEGLVAIAIAVRDGFLDISQYKLTLPSFYDAVMEQVKILESQPAPDIKFATSTKKSEQVLESFIGFGARDLKEQLIKYESLLSQLTTEGKRDADYSSKKKDLEAIILGLKNSIAITESEYVEKKKEGLEWAIKEVEASGEIGKLDVERQKVLHDINKEIGDNAELTQLVNSLYDVQKQKIEESYKIQLDSQLFAISNENELLEIEHQREEALRKLNEEGLNTEENIRKINQLYDEIADKTLNNALQELTHRRQINEVLTESEKIEIERQREIEETNRKYGQQTDLLKEINLYYDRLQERIQETKSLYDQLEDSFRKAIGKDAYDELKKFGETIVKVGKFVQGFSMIWNSLSAAVTSHYDTSALLRQREIESIREELRERQEESAQALEQLRGENNEELTSLRKMYDGDTISYDEYMRRKKGIEDDYEEKQRKAKKEAIELENQLLMAQYEAELEQFKVNKATAIANAVIAGAQGIMQAWALGPIAGAIGSGVIAGAMAYQISQIESQPAPKPPTLTPVPFAYGGVVTSPTLSLIGEANEPEAVIPLSRAKEFGFGKDDGGDTFNITGNTFVGVGGIDELVKLIEERKQVLVGRGAF